MVHQRVEDTYMGEREDREWKNKEVPFTKAAFPSHLNKLCHKQPKHISKTTLVCKEKYIFYREKSGKHIL